MLSYDDLLGQHQHLQLQLENDEELDNDNAQHRQPLFNDLGIDDSLNNHRSSSSPPLQQLPLFTPSTTAQDEGGCCSSSSPAANPPPPLISSSSSSSSSSFIHPQQQHQLNHHQNTQNPHHSLGHYYNNNLNRHFYQQSIIPHQILHQQQLQQHHHHQQQQQQAPTVTLFITKLYSLLENPEFSDYVGWNRDGDVFHIYNTEEFAEQVLPKLFSTSIFSSFQRQLNIYGFKVVSNVKKSEMVRNKEAGVFWHPKFFRGRRDLLPEIRRRVSAKKKPNASASSGNNSKRVAHAHGTTISNDDAATMNSLLSSLSTSAANPTSRVIISSPLSAISPVTSDSLQTMIPAPGDLKAMCVSSNSSNSSSPGIVPYLRVENVDGNTTSTHYPPLTAAEDDEAPPNDEQYGLNGYESGASSFEPSAPRPLSVPESQSPYHSSTSTSSALSSSFGSSFNGSGFSTPPTSPLLMSHNNDNNSSSNSSHTSGGGGVLAGWMSTLNVHSPSAAAIMARHSPSHPQLGSSYSDIRRIPFNAETRSRSNTNPGGISINYDTRARSNTSPGGIPIHYGGVGAAGGSLNPMMPSSPYHGSSSLSSSSNSSTAISAAGKREYGNMLDPNSCYSNVGYRSTNYHAQYFPQQQQLSHYQQQQYQQQHYFNNGNYYSTATSNLSSPSYNNNNNISCNSPLIPQANTSYFNSPSTSTVPPATSTFEQISSYTPPTNTTAVANLQDQKRMRSVSFESNYSDAGFVGFEPVPPKPVVSSSDLFVATTTSSSSLSNSTTIAPTTASTSSLSASTTDAPFSTSIDSQGLSDEWKLFSAFGDDSSSMLHQFSS